MKTVYLDSEFKCHLSDDGTRTAFETGYFDDKCDVYTEGFRIVPEGKSWVREDGSVFTGEMIAPWQDYDVLLSAQNSFEQEKIAEYERLINELYEEVL